MEFNSSLIMNEFLSYMSNFFIVMGICSVATLILTFGYIFIFKPYDKENDEGL